MKITDGIKLGIGMLLVNIIFNVGANLVGALLAYLGVGQ